MLSHVTSLKHISICFALITLLMCGPVAHAQELAERNWVDVDTTKLWHVDGDEKLQVPVRMRLFGENLLIQDMGATKLKRFDLGGNFLNAIGEGQGQGPGEVQLVYDWAAANDRVYILDEEASRLHKFDMDGDYIESYVTSPQHQRIAPLSDSIVMLSILQSKVFTQIDFFGQEMGQFGDEVGSRVNAPPALDGYMVGKGDIFAYLPMYAGKVFIYSQDGEIERVIETIDGHEFLEARSVPVGYMRPDASFVHSEIVFDEGHMFIHVTVHQNGTVRAHLDRYTWPEGEYIDSMEMPSEFAGFQLHEGKIFVLERQGTDLKAFKLEW